MKRKILKIFIDEENWITLYKLEKSLYEVVSYNGNYHYRQYGLITEAIDTIRHLRHYSKASHEQK
jgi:hypothetical protein